jgi:hypothetical protein
MATSDQLARLGKVKEEKATANSLQAEKAELAIGIGVQTRRREEELASNNESVLSTEKHSTQICRCLREEEKTRRGK